MKAVWLLLLLAALPLPAQAPQRRVQPVDPTPATARPQGTAALNTAQFAGARDGVRLHGLPDLTALQVDGTMAQVISLPHPGYWLLLYRGLHCVPCDHMLDALTQSANAALRSGSGLIVLVDSGITGGDDRLHDMRTRYNTLANAVWLDDREGMAFAALKPSGKPMLYAMQGETIAWSAPGMLGDGKTLATLASSWVARNSPPTNPAASAGAGK